MPAQFFEILGEGGEVVERFVLERLRFHFAVFPFVDLPDMEEH